MLRLHFKMALRTFTIIHIAAGILAALATTIKNIPPQQCPENIPADGYSCVKSCDGKANGDYKSCIDCDVYLTCSHGRAIDNRPCPSGLHWNDRKRKCTYRKAANCKLSGRFGVDLANDNYGQSQLNQGGVTDQHKKWKLMTFENISVSDLATIIDTNSSLVYQLSPPRCLRELHYSFEASSPELPMNVAILDSDDFDNGPVGISIFSTSDTNGSITLVNIGTTNLHAGPMVGYKICGEIRDNYISFSGINDSKSVDTFNSRPKIYERIGSKKFSFVLNGDIFVGSDPQSYASKMNIYWKC